MYLIHGAEEQRSGRFNRCFVMRDLTEHSTLQLVEFSLFVDCKGSYGDIEHGSEVFCRGFVFHGDAYLCCDFLPWQKGRRGLLWVSGTAANFPTRQFLVLL